ILQTFGRSISTSLTVILTLLALLLFGGTAIDEFILTLLIGIISGTYSSIFVAAPLLVDWQLWDDRRRGRVPVTRAPRVRRTTTSSGAGARWRKPWCSRAWHPDGRGRAAFPLGLLAGGAGVRGPRRRRHGPRPLRSDARGAARPRRDRPRGPGRLVPR